MLFAGLISKPYKIELCDSTIDFSHSVLNEQMDVLVRKTQTERKEWN